MKKFFALLLVVSFSFGTKVKADEGMWLLNLISKLNYQDMQANGLQLTPEQLYSINNASLKDAIVSLGGFCTGEIISSEGLMLTNHHCGYDAIRTHSTVEDDYLTNGFWAKNRAEEKPNEGLYVRILVSMEDVTGRVMEGLTDDMTEAQRQQKAEEIGQAIAAEATEGNDHKALVQSMFHNNEFYLFIYEEYRDVRLVGAPPSAVGKYGGDTDNWMWPRHTGDFSMFRIYTDAEGKSADFAEGNVPFKPKHHLPVSLDGVKDGDFTMVFGFPGSTDRYLSSFGVKQAIDKYNPTVVEIRDQKLAVMRAEMAKSDAVRLALASNYAQTANYWKYYIGQTEQLKNNKVYDKKKAIEKDFSNWMTQDTERQVKYKETLELLEGAYAESDATVRSDVYLMEAGLIGPQSTIYAWRTHRLLKAYFETADGVKAAQKATKDKAEKEKIAQDANEKMAQIAAAIKAQSEEHYAEYHQATDKQLVAKLWGMYKENVSADQQPAFFSSVVDAKYKGDMQAYADDVFANSIYVNKDKLYAFLDNPKKKDWEKETFGAAAADMVEGMYFQSQSRNAATQEKLDRGYRLLTAGLREMNPDKKYSPDANSTIRMSWGTVGSYHPKDAVLFNYYTTIEGIIQKEDPTNKEFIVPEKLKSLYDNKDYGQYADENGELPVCFISNNDITGGNSGSPVINGRGELIGCAFDGNWEAMSGDIFFETELQRTISVDIRYVLFIIEKLGDAKHLIDEMTLVKTEVPAPVEEASAE